ncbi:centrosomal protein CCDC61 [Brienomyrus brachyistius]|uniref:centrosomal protein CCDC61 n=1 Tax=Brienomyrus brachyistius TaxID=42636 RepID=UPI0020B33D5B|nr:centrosomal protein CCDC61 [Brienomyrus brachyistius]XP_048838282.1 centrosomal protein CCDC61 [Brienomyrus brachyistius]
METVQADMDFRGSEFTVRVEVEEELLVVEILDLTTAEQWRGEFDPTYIEDLTRKTGNFKQFSIFCSMLESAVRRTSEAVTLDLLTYSDLELLRSRKTGQPSKARSQPQSPALSTKRYLILVYTVEFDRIHYPLPLPYQGKPDPAALQREIRVLRAELAALVAQGGRSRQDPETSRLRAELARLQGEKDALARALDQLQVAGVGRTPGGGARGLREVIQSLEEQLLRERAKNQRSASKRNQEKRQLLEELEELRASERALRVRVKSLTSELALMQRCRASPLASCRSSSGGEGPGRRSASRDRGLPGGPLRGRSGSRGRVEDRSGRADAAVQRTGSTGSRPHIPRPSPSPSGSQPQRFDPTGYIQDRQRKQREAELKNQRKVRRAMLSPVTNTERGRSRSRNTQLTRLGSGRRGRSSSIESGRSSHFSDGSLVDMPEIASHLPSRTRKISCNSAAVTLPRGRNLTKKPLCSTPAGIMTAMDKESADLSEIDARLQALQDYMRDLDTGR